MSIFNHLWSSKSSKYEFLKYENTCQLPLDREFCDTGSSRPEQIHLVQQAKSLCLCNHDFPSGGSPWIVASVFVPNKTGAIKIKLHTCFV